jgi:hypothetical protein
MDQPPFIGTQSRWVKHALNAIHLLLLATIAYIGVVTWWLWHFQWDFEFHLYLFVILPALAAVYAWWLWVDRAIRADIVRCQKNEPMRSGIPHHGIFFVKACALLLGLGISPGIMVVCFRHELHNGLIVFGLNHVLGSAMVIVAVLVLRRLEKGYDPMLDFDGRKVIPT